jgi:hypothetical protein
MLVALLVVIAFAIGVVRPWDWLGAAGVPNGGDQPASAVIAGGVPATAAIGPRQSPPETAAQPPPAALAQPACAYPERWRTAAIQDWGGRVARVWSAAGAVTVASAGDPAIPFFAVVSTTVMALGWCAPVSGPDRPPLDATGTLFRITPGGPLEVPVVRLEPNAPDPLGELWAPQGAARGGRTGWPPGRYVIRLATPDGTYQRYLGIEVERAFREAAPTGAPTGLPTTGPSPSGSPGAVPTS